MASSWRVHDENVNLNPQVSVMAEKLPKTLRNFRSRKIKIQFSRKNKIKSDFYAALWSADQQLEGFFLDWALLLPASSSTNCTSARLFLHSSHNASLQIPAEASAERTPPLMVHHKNTISSDRQKQWAAHERWITPRRSGAALCCCCCCSLGRIFRIKKTPPSFSALSSKSAEILYLQMH